MRTRLTYLLLLIGVVLAGCKRRPMYDVYGGNVHLEIDIQTEEYHGIIPVGMNVNFYDLYTRNTSINTIVGPTGGCFTVTPGSYDLMVYNYDTEYTRVRNENNAACAEAFTNEVPGQVRRTYESLMKALVAVRSGSSRSYANEPLINQPDHLYVGTVDNVTVPMSEDEDRYVTIRVLASSLAETYKLIVRTVTGMEYLSMADAFVSGQASSKMLYDRKVSGGPASLWVSLSAVSSTEFSAYFTTFGKYDQGDGKVWVVLRLADLNDKIYTWEFDVTDQVDSGSHVIIVDADIHIEPTEAAGGLAPDVEDWEDVVTNINM